MQRHDDIARVELSGALPRSTPEARFEAVERSRRTSGVKRQQLPLGDDDVGQPEQAEQLHFVFD